jgi:hypothetical protein
MALVSFCLFLKGTPSGVVTLECRDDDQGLLKRLFVVGGKEDTRQTRGDRHAGQFASEVR